MSDETRQKRAGDGEEFAALQAKLDGKTGASYWRSLDEIAESPEFKAYLDVEFPSQVEKWDVPFTRRQMLKYMAASFALAGVTACTRQPFENIIPYTDQPEKIVPGKPLFFATGLKQFGVTRGVLVESHTGRPTKIEGNPLHPDSLGATDIFSQAAVLDLYDPDRSRAIQHQGLASSWDAFSEMVRRHLEFQATKDGAGIRILTGPTDSPTLHAQMRDFLKRFPKARVFRTDPADSGRQAEATRLAFGRPLRPVYDISAADVILNIDADFLYAGPGAIRYAREFADRRRSAKGKTTSMNRLYTVEPYPTVSGTSSDHRQALTGAEIEIWMQALAAEFGLAPAPPTTPGQWLKEVAADLRTHAGRSLVVVGDNQPVHVQMWAFAINEELAATGRTVRFVDALGASGVPFEPLADLVSDMRNDGTEILFILDANPVYTAPADFRFAEALANVGVRVHVGPFHDETANLCHWHIPLVHELEGWSDGRAHDGTVTIIQPLIRPLFGSRSLHEIFSVLNDGVTRPPYESVRNHWTSMWRTTDFEARWRRSVHDGIVADSALPLQSPRVRRGAPRLPKAPDTGGLEIVFKPDPAIWDGRYANNAWLQECPKPVTALTWDNAALLSPRTADRLGVTNHQNVELTFQGATVEASAFVVPGQADECVVVHLGYGRTRAGRIGNDVGFNAYSLRTSGAPAYGRGLQLKKVGGRRPLATTQVHHGMEGRDIIRAGTLAQFQENPAFAQGTHAGGAEFDPGWPIKPSEDYQWGMTIDLNACIGCNACTIACQSENNIPVVGKDEVLKGREMHWIRVDTYHKGDIHQPDYFHQPVPCMHCENAPCEPVCPVGATVHSDEGLNEMVYNRCVGTRYCSNNCPYKVRRFNFYRYADGNDASLQKMQKNPDVTVRMRGVMEKCTYCVQKISSARIDAKKDGRLIRDGEVTPSCASVCPTKAIVFGNVADPASRVSISKKDPRNYQLLAELNTQPRTSYLAALRNPNPAIAPEPAEPLRHG